MSQWPCAFQDFGFVSIICLSAKSEAQHCLGRATGAQHMPSIASSAALIVRKAWIRFGLLKDGRIRVIG